MSHISMPVRRIDRRPDGRFDMEYRQDSENNFQVPTDEKRRISDSLSANSGRQELRDLEMQEVVLGSTYDGDMQATPPQVNTTPSASGAHSYPMRISPRVTTLYTISYLILFALLGTLTRIGLNSATFFPGTPVAFSSLWANFAGTLLMGFIVEDRMIFKQEWGVPVYDMAIKKAATSSDGDSQIDLGAAKKAHGATKKTIPLFIGLATGLCGSITSFSSFIRDVFLALSNSLPLPTVFTTEGTAMTTTSTTPPRSALQCIMAAIAVIIVTICVVIMTLRLGMAMAQVLERYIPTIPFMMMRQFLDRLAVILGLGGWVLAIGLSIFPPDVNLRGIALFSLVFAPVGCLGRFYASMLLNSRYPTFPLGTFVVNILGTVILGVAFNFQHSKVLSVVGCQVLQGIMDGFCGALTTISTFAVEVTTLKLGYAYVYGVSSVGLALGLMIAIMGAFAWTVGFSETACVH